MGRHFKSKKTNKKKTATSSSSDGMKRNPNKGERPVSGCWVDKVRLETVDANDVSNVSVDTVSIISWNVLAEAYCSRHSQVHLPVQYQKVVFSKRRRKELLLRTLERLLCIRTGKDIPIDVICLQEVDLPEIGDTLRTVGYVGVETPRVVGGGAGGRSDGCAVYVRESTGTAPDVDDNDGTSECRWQLVDHEIVRLDDLATLSSTTNDTITSKESDVKSSAVNTNSNVQGMQMSLLRRNMGLIVRLRNLITGKTIIIANAHLYWNPGFEYVKVQWAYYTFSFGLRPWQPFHLRHLQTHTHCFVRSCSRSTVMSGPLYFKTRCCFSEF